MRGNTPIRLSACVVSVLRINDFELIVNCLHVQLVSKGNGRNRFENAICDIGLIVMFSGLLLLGPGT